MFYLTNNKCDIFSKSYISGQTKRPKKKENQHPPTAASEELGAKTGGQSKSNALRIPLYATCNVGDPSSICGSGRSHGKGIGYPLQYSWASLVAQLVKNPPAMRKT